MLIVILIFQRLIHYLLAFAMIYQIDTTLSLTVTMGNSDKNAETLRKYQREKVVKYCGTNNYRGKIITDELLCIHY